MTLADALKILKSFEKINKYVNRKKVIDTIVELAKQSDSIADKDFLNLMRELDKIGIMIEDSDLMFKARTYFD